MEFILYREAQYRHKLKWNPKLTRRIVTVISGENITLSWASSQTLGVMSSYKINLWDFKKYPKILYALKGLLFLGIQM